MWMEAVNRDPNFSSRVKLDSSMRIMDRQNWKLSLDDKNMTHKIQLNKYSEEVEKVKRGIEPQPENW